MIILTFFTRQEERTCYIAPGKLSSSPYISTNESTALISEQTICDSEDLTPAMDNFSAR